MLDNPQRYKISLVFGYGHIDWNVDEFFRLMEEQICIDFGGCRIDEKRGLWTDDGNKSRPHFGEIFEEESVEFTILTSMSPEDFHWYIQEAAKYARYETDGDVPMEWVNVEYTQVQQGHFNMQGI